MDSQPSVKILSLLLLLTLISIPNGVSAIPTREYESMLSILRARGYNLFPNAIATSDLQFQLLSSSANDSFTLFAPTDSSLFSLDLTETASFYLTTLRYHVVPRRYSIYDLRHLPAETTLPTLIPSRNLRLTRYELGSQMSDVISIGGVDVVLPGLFYGRYVAVHGLGSNLDLRSHEIGAVNSPPISSGKSTETPSTDRKFNVDPVLPNIAAPPSTMLEDNILNISPTADGYAPSSNSPDDIGDYSFNDSTDWSPSPDRGFSPTVQLDLETWMRSQEAQNLEKIFRDHFLNLAPTTKPVGFKNSYSPGNGGGSSIDDLITASPSQDRRYPTPEISPHSTSLIGPGENENSYSPSSPPKNRGDGSSSKDFTGHPSKSTRRYSRTSSPTLALRIRSLQGENKITVTERSTMESVSDSEAESKLTSRNFRGCLFEMCDRNHVETDNPKAKNSIAL